MVYTGRDAKAIDNIVGDDYMESDPGCSSMKMIYILRIKVRVGEPINIFKPITTNNGVKDVKDYMVLVFFFLLINNR